VNHVKCCPDFFGQCSCDLIQIVQTSAINNLEVNVIISESLCVCFYFVYVLRMILF